MSSLSSVVQLGLLAVAASVAIKAPSPDKKEPQQPDAPASPVQPPITPLEPTLQRDEEEVTPLSQQESSTPPPSPEIQAMTSAAPPLEHFTHTEATPAPLVDNDEIRDAPKEPQEVYYGEESAMTHGFVPVPTAGDTQPQPAVSDNGVIDDGMQRGFVTVTPPMSASHARPASFEQEVEVGRSSEDATSPISPVDPVTPITPASPTTFIAAGSSPGGAGAAPSPISKSELAKLDKLGRKDSKRVKAVLKDQAKADERTLEYAVKEVARLQVSHKDALKAESKTIKHFDEALKVEQKANAKFQEVKAMYEKTAAGLAARQEEMDTAKSHSQLQATLLEEQTRKVEMLREAKARDDRERAAQLSALKK